MRNFVSVKELQVKLITIGTMTFKRFNELKEQGAPTIKLAGITFFGEELEELMEKNERYIIKYRNIYYLDVANYKTEPKFKVSKVWHTDDELPFTKRNRYYTMDYKSVNHLLGNEIFAY